MDRRLRGAPSNTAVGARHAVPDQYRGATEPQYRFATHLVTRRSFLAAVTLLTVAATNRIIAARRRRPPRRRCHASAGSSIRPTGVGDVPSTAPAGQVLRTSSWSDALWGSGARRTGDRGRRHRRRYRIPSRRRRGDAGSVRPMGRRLVQNLGALGTIGNVVMAGHIDYWKSVPPSFTTSRRLSQERRSSSPVTTARPIPSPSNGSASTTRRRSRSTRWPDRLQTKV